jgi:integrase
MYLERKWQTYWAAHDIPRDVQATLGTGGKPKRRFIQNLHTPDKDIATARAKLLEGKWRLMIERARKGGLDIEAQADFYRHALKDAPPAMREALIGEVTDQAMRIAHEQDGVPYDYVAPGEDAESRPGYKEGLKLIGMATGELVKLGEKTAEYFATLTGKIEPKSIGMVRNTLNTFCADPAFAYIGDVTPKAVQQWASRQTMAPKTVRRWLSELRGYWRYLQSLEEAPAGAGPFDKLTLPKKTSGGKEEKRQPFAPADVLKLLAEARKQKDAPLADLIELGMWSGARIEELSSLRVEHVNIKAKYFEVAFAKTEAGQRQIPIHSKLAPTMKRLVSASKDGFVLSGLAANTPARGATPRGRSMTVFAWTAWTAGPRSILYGSFEAFLVPSRSRLP